MSFAQRDRRWLVGDLISKGLSQVSIGHLMGWSNVDDDEMHATYTKATGHDLMVGEFARLRG